MEKKKEEVHKEAESAGPGRVVFQGRHGDVRKVDKDLSGKVRQGIGDQLSCHTSYSATLKFAPPAAREQPERSPCAVPKVVPMLETLELLLLH